MRREPAQARIMNGRRFWRGTGSLPAEAACDVPSKVDSSGEGWVSPVKIVMTAIADFTGETPVPRQAIQLARRQVPMAANRTEVGFSPALDPREQGGIEGVGLRSIPAFPDAHALSFFLRGLFHGLRFPAAIS